jgi:sensor domain CHASE-containing protein
MAMFRLHSKILTLMILAMGFLLLTTMAYHIAHQKEAEQFNLAYKENLSRSIHNIIRMKEYDLNKTTFDYCIWDEMVEFVHTADPAWAGENLNTLLTTLGCSYVAVFDETFRLVYSDCDSAGFGSRSFLLPVEQLKEAM